MTVAELQALLATCDPTAHVMTVANGHWSRNDRTRVAEVQRWESESWRTIVIGNFHDDDGKGRNPNFVLLKEVVPDKTNYDGRLRTFIDQTTE